MQLRHIRPRSIDWVDAMDEGGRGWEKLAPEELTKLRVGAQTAGTWDGSKGGAQEGDGDPNASDDYGWRAGSASR
jgi:hypothetical protein